MAVRNWKDKPGEPLLSGRQFPFICPMPQVHRARSLDVTPKLLEKKKKRERTFLQSQCPRMLMLLSKLLRIPTGQREQGCWGEGRKEK